MKLVSSTDSFAPNNIALSPLKKLLIYLFSIIEDFLIIYIWFSWFTWWKVFPNNIFYCFIWISCM